MPKFTAQLEQPNPSISTGTVSPIDYSGIAKVASAGLEQAADTVDTSRVGKAEKESQAVLAEFSEDASLMAQENPYEALRAATAAGEKEAIKEAEQEILRIQTGKRSGRFSPAVAKLRLDRIEQDFRGRFPHLGNQFNAIRTNAASSVDATFAGLGLDKETEYQKEVNKALTLKDQAMRDLIASGMDRDAAEKEFDHLRGLEHQKRINEAADAMGIRTEPQARTTMTTNVQSYIAQSMQALGKFRGSPEQMRAALTAESAKWKSQITFDYTGLSKDGAKFNHQVLSDAMGLYDAWVSGTMAILNDNVTAARAEKTATKHGSSRFAEILTHLSVNFKNSYALEKPDKAGQYATDIINMVLEGYSKAGGIPAYVKQLEDQRQAASGTDSNPEVVNRYNVVLELLREPKKVAEKIMGAFLMSPDQLNKPYDMMNTEEKVVHMLMGKQFSKNGNLPEVDKKLLEIVSRTSNPAVFTPGSRSKYQASPELQTSHDNFVTNNKFLLGGQLEFFGSTVGNIDVKVDESALDNVLKQQGGHGRTRQLLGKPLVVDLKPQISTRQAGQRDTAGVFNYGAKVFNYGVNRGALKEYVDFVNHNASMYAYMGRMEEAQALLTEAQSTLMGAMDTADIEFELQGDKFVRSGKDTKGSEPINQPRLVPGR